MKKNYSAVEQLFVVLTEKWHYETSKSGSSLKKFNFFPILTLFFLLIGSALKAQTTVTFTTTSSWTCPAGVFNIKVEAYGAGGGGGGGQGSSGDNGGGGGGGGAYTVINSVTTIPGTNYIITVGAGGGAGTAGASGKAGDGTATTATFGATTITANGGIGGYNHGFGGNAGGTGGAAGTFAGGNGAAGTNARSGGAGGAGGTTSAGVNGNNATGGNGGGGSAGKGGNGSGANNTAGQTGSNYGGGGGAGTGTSNGGSGAGGYFIITYTSSSGCTNTTQYPSGSIAAPTTNTPVTISTTQYQSEYNAITGIVSGSTYILSNNLGGFVTIHSGTYNGTVVAAGNSPLTWTPSSSGTFYVHWNTNSSCGTASNSGTTTIQCSSCGGGGTATNNECSTATPLSVTGTCSYATYTTQGATQSTTTPLPTCASFAGGDVWFSAVVPANG